MIIGVVQHFSLPIKSPVMVFAIVLIIILLTPILLKKLRVPSIIGLISAGVVIGPNGLHLLEKNAAIDLFSAIGLLYVMFIAGLELDMRQFNRTKHKSLVFGTFTFLLPLIIGLPVCYYLLDYNFTASLLIASMFSTHTLIAYPIVSRLGIAKEEPVAITVGGTILTDTLVLLILALNIGIATGDTGNFFYLRLFISIVLFLIILFYVFPKISRWFFKRFENEKHAHFIYVLAVVFSSGSLAEFAGVEPIIGAFMAGLALNRLIPERSPLMNRIEFAGNSLFIPFFLISVGMLVDLKILLQGPGALIVAGTLTLVAVTGKWLAAFLTQHIFRYPAVYRNLIFGLSSAHAVATLAVITVGYNLGIIDDTVLNGTVVLIFITSLIASLITEQAGKKMLIESIPKKALQDGMEEKILVPVSNPNTFKRLLEFAMYIKDNGANNQISALSVILEHDNIHQQQLASKKLLNGIVEHGSGADLKIDVYTKVDINILGGIVRAAKETQSNLLVIGASPKKDFIERLFGNFFDKIVESYHETLFVCRLIHPLNIARRITVLFPQNAEKEPGFTFILDKLFALSINLAKPLEFHCTTPIRKSIERYLPGLKNKPVSTFKPIEEIQDFFNRDKHYGESDLLIFVSARRGMVSYTPKYKVIKSSKADLYKNTNFIIAYPSEYS
ncbi:MAG: cation:proton antiporter [Bacteroidales bacterium]|nr:cation:proton antiporter [Bacteroidales bacterium]